MTLTGIPDFKKIWYVSLPIMLSMLAQNILSATDTAFLGHYGDGQTELGAAAIGGIYFHVLFMLGFGFATGMQILISRRKGENKLQDIGPIMENGIMFLWAMAAVLIVSSIVFTPIIMPSIISHGNILEPSIDFLNIRIYGLIFVFVNVSYRAFFVGTANTRPLTYGSIIMASTNIALDYVLIFGKFGFPEMGIKGAALATVIAEAVEATYFIILSSRAKIRKVYKLFYFKRPDLKLLKHTLSISVYVMLQYFISLCTWFAFFVMIEKTGELNLASSNIVRNIYAFITIPIWAYAAATSSFVSSAIGAGHISSVPAIIRKIVKIGVVTSAILILPVSFLAKPILSIYTNNADLINNSVASIYVILAVNLIFACGCISFNGLSGTGKTKVAMLLEIFALVFYVFALYMLISSFPNNVEYAWLSELVYWGMVLMLTLLYFRFGKWRTAKV